MARTSTRRQPQPPPPGPQSQCLRLVLVSLVCVFLFFQLVGEITELSCWKPQFNRIDRQQQQEQQRKPKLGDGCYHVFLDVGANIGVHGRFLFEPDRYPNSRVARPIFNEHFEFQGNRTLHRSDYCVFAFEPNPVHIPRFQQLQQAYQRMGWRLHFISAGVGAVNGNLTFYRLDDDNRENWGFTASRTIPQGEKVSPVTVPVIRLSEWVQEHIQGRLLPKHNNNTNETRYLPPKVLMKLDIENMEVEVLPDLLLTGVFCQVFDYVFGETHFHLGGRGYFPFTTYNGVQIPNSASAQQFFQNLDLAMRIAPGCRTVFDGRDDESYLHDGVPFPEPPQAS